MLVVDMIVVGRDIPLLFVNVEVAVVSCMRDVSG